jgi:hypothetical protein
MLKDTEADEAWLSQQHIAVGDYLARQGVRHGQIGEWPAWHLRPYLAIWAIESAASPGRIGWWAISGDVPFDYLGFRDAEHPRDAMRHFARKWEDVASHMLSGQPHPDISIGSEEEWPELGEVLMSRAAVLRQFSDNDSIWEAE